MTIGAPNAGTATTFTAATTSAVPFPATVTAGTVLVLSWSQFTLGTTVTTPAGWTLREYIQGTAGTTAGNVAVFWKVAAGTEGGTNLTVTHGSTAAEAQIVEWSGVDTTTPFDVSDSTLDDNATSNATIILPSMTPVTANVTLGYACASNTAAQTTGTLPAGFTQLSNGSGASCNMLSGYKQNVAAGATGTVTVTFSGSGKQVGILYALRPNTSPAAGGATVTVASSDAAGSVAPNATESTGTVLASDATTTVQGSATESTLTIASSDATPSVAPNATESTLTVAAFDATVSTASATNANAVESTLTVAAADATTAVSPNAAGATATVLASDSTPAVSANATGATATVASSDATVTTAVSAAAVESTATVSAYDATVQTSSVVIAVKATAASSVYARSRGSSSVKAGVHP